MTSAVLRFTGLLALAVAISGVAVAQDDGHNHGGQKPATPIDKPFVPPTTAPKPKPPVKLPPNVVARVGNQDITRDEVLAVFNMVGGRPIVDQVVQSTVLEQEARRLGVTVTADELSKAVQEAKDRIVQQSMMMGQPQTFKEIAAREGYNDDLIRWSVRLDILRRKAFTKAIEKQVPTRDNQRQLAHILAATIDLPKPGEQPKTLTPEETQKRDTDAKAKMEALLADLKAGKITWDEAAKQSEDVSNANQGGDLGWHGKNEFDPDFEKVAFEIQKDGEIVGPVKSRYGWHLIKLVRDGKSLSPAEKTEYRKQQIEAMLTNRQMQENWLRSLQSKNQVTFNRQVQIVPNAKLPARMMSVTPSSKKPAAAKTTASGKKPGATR